MSVNPKQAKFVREYLIDLNATKAAERAGYSSKTAHVIGHELLRKPNVAQEIESTQKRIAAEAGITPEKVLAELSKMGFSNMQDFMKSNSEGDPYLDFSELTRDQAAALTEVTVEDFIDRRGGGEREVKRVKFKLADKISALEKIGRHIGMFKNESANDKATSAKDLSLVIIGILREVATGKPMKQAEVKTLELEG